MSHALRSLARRLPDSYTRELRRYRYQWQISHSQFRSPEPEYEAVGGWLSSGDWVVDGGANVGHYTIQFARSWVLRDACSRSSLSHSRLLS
jgi:hypothetical protein